MKKNKPFILLLLLPLIFSCAQVVAPTGGPKDVTPPKMLTAEPPQEQTHFDAEIIAIAFDEYVQFKKLNEQLLISPPMKHEPTTEIRGRKLLIGIKDTLQSNTTYVMNFGNSIVDLNEGNPFGNFTYVFSTGGEVDSLSLKGQVLDAYSLKADKDILVMLYQDFYDSLPMKELPKYVSRTDEEGKFFFSNLKEGEYTVLAIEDKNKNYKYDAVGEKMAFMEKKIKLGTKQDDSLALFLFTEENPLTYLLESKAVEGSFRLIFNKPTDSVYIESITNAAVPEHFIERNRTGDSAQIWFPGADFPFAFQAAIKDGSKTVDTVQIKIPKLKNDSNLSLANKLPSIQNYFEPLQLVLSAPLAKVNKKRIQLFQNDSVAVDFELKYQKNSQSIKIQHKWKEGQKYKLIMLPNAAVDIFNRENDSIQQTFSVNKAEQFSSLKVDVETSSASPMIIQLLDDNGKLLREEKVEKGAVLFEHLSAASYLLKVIFDENNNGKWDTGKYFSKQFPEKAVLFDGKIKLRPKWEQELIWKIK